MRSHQCSRDSLLPFCIAKPSWPKEWSVNHNPSLAAAPLTAGLSLSVAIRAAAFHRFPSQLGVAMGAHLNRASESAVTMNTAIIVSFHLR
jgi:hypothetical protein